MTQQARQREAAKLIKQVQDRINKLKKLNYGLDSSWNNIGFFDMLEKSDTKIFKSLDTSFSHDIQYKYSTPTT